MKTNYDLIKQAFNNELAAAAFSADFQEQHHENWSVDFNEEMDMQLEQFYWDNISIGAEILSKNNINSIAEIALFHRCFSSEVKGIERNDQHTFEGTLTQLGNEANAISKMDDPEVLISQLKTVGRTEEAMKLQVKLNEHTNLMNTHLFSDAIDKLKASKFDVNNIEDDFNNFTTAAIDCAIAVSHEIAKNNVMNEETRSPSSEIEYRYCDVLDKEMGLKINELSNVFQALEFKHTSQLGALDKKVTGNQNYQEISSLTDKVNNKEREVRRALYNDVFEQIESTKEEQIANMFVAKEITDATISNNEFTEAVKGIEQQTDLLSAVLGQTIQEPQNDFLSKLSNSIELESKPEEQQDLAALLNASFGSMKP
ncbi:hypothetical protein VCHA53O466_40316 [Vibrio chagasii]|nr:hypothetical protein VCHA53O466_40316 [Vibrio chagasii]